MYPCTSAACSPAAAAVAGALDAGEAGRSSPCAHSPTAAEVQSTEYASDSSFTNDGSKDSSFKDGRSDSKESTNDSLNERGRRARRGSGALLRALTSDSLALRTMLDARDFEIPSASVTIGSMLGCGQFGRVFAARWQGAECAIKFLSNDTHENVDVLYEREITTIARLHHPHLVQFFGFVCMPSAAGGDAETGLAMELCMVPLDLYVSKPTRWISNRTKRRFCTEMAAALAYLHNRTPKFVIHRDIKPSNFMLSASLRIKLADFGLSRLFERVARAEHDGASHLNWAERADAAAEEDLDNSKHGMSTLEQTSNCGTARYMAPEASAHAHESASQTATFSTAVDVYSLAMVYFFVWEREPPTLPVGSAKLYLTAIAAGRRPPFTAKTTAGARRLIEAAWATNPKERPRALELVERWHELNARASQVFGCFRRPPR